MLRSLRISNVAIVDELEISLAPGLNVLTGETGAGKSIITRAIGLLCGERAYTDLIRTESDEAEIEGLFDLAPSEVALLTDAGIAAADELLIRRTIQRSGKGKVWINGSLATATMLAQLGRALIHLYGQHEQTLLLKSENHLDVLDEFGRVGAERLSMAATYASFREAADRLTKAKSSGDAARQRAELLRFQSQELRSANIAAGEETSLQQERERLRHAEKLGRACQDGEEALYASDDAIVSAIGRVAAQVEEATRIDAEFKAPGDLLRQASMQIEEAALQLRRIGGHIHDDPERLAEIEERLALISRLRRKYDCDADVLAVRLATVSDELDELDALTSDLGGVEETVRERAATAWDSARALSTARQSAAKKLERQMAKELGVLGMEGGVFRVVFTVRGSDGPPTGADTSGLTNLGADVVEFYLSANPGEDPKPLARIASGGELSRIMLALKTLTSSHGEDATLIFDEVDAGIGGTVADAVGKRLQILGKSRQILCITHLPQIAALADHHFGVQKQVARGRTTSQARALEGDDRVREIARMLGGNDSDSERYARRLLNPGGKRA